MLALRCFILNHPYPPLGGNAEVMNMSYEECIEWMKNDRAACNAM
jgi:hypothetical protein